MPLHKLPNQNLKHIINLSNQLFHIALPLDHVCLTCVTHWGSYPALSAGCQCVQQSTEAANQSLQVIVYLLQTGMSSSGMYF